MLKIFRLPNAAFSRGIVKQSSGASLPTESPYSIVCLDGPLQGGVGIGDEVDVVIGDGLLVVLLVTEAILNGLMSLICLLVISSFNDHPTCHLLA